MMRRCETRREKLFEKIDAQKNFPVIPAPQIDARCHSVILYWCYTTAQRNKLIAISVVVFDFSFGLKNQTSNCLKIPRLSCFFELEKLWMSLFDGFINVKFAFEALSRPFLFFLFMFLLFRFLFFYNMLRLFCI